MGLSKQMRNSGKMIVYNKNITLNHIKEAVEQVFKTKPLENPCRQIKMYTGERGMWDFDWILKYGDTIKCHKYIKNLKVGVYISLFKKSGNFKVLVKNTKFIFYKGTEVINVIDDVINQWEIIGDMNSQKVPLRIDLVNKYIDGLKFAHDAEQKEIDLKIKEDKIKRENENN